MNPLLETSLRAAAIGIGATAVMDLWLLALRRLGVPTLDFALLGRWVAHVACGTWWHHPIGKSAPMPRERLLGWLTHYAVGVAFAAALVLACGAGWTQRPTFAPALIAGLLTVAAPLLVMQPAMGAGIAARRTPTPLRNGLRSVANHAVFGGGLYLTALALARLA